MERYVDGFLLPIAKDQVGKYREVAELAGKVWKEHGALECYECIADDLTVKDMVSFEEAADAAAGETVIFSWIVFESKQHRDQVNEAAMNDPRLKAMGDSTMQLFDYKRMAYGGFRTLVKLT